MAHQILFQNPVFHSGLNVTIRKGDKWMKANIGDDLEIMRTGNESQIVLHGTVVGKMLLPANLVPNETILLEHDPDCRNQEGLMAEMKRVYPDFEESSLVTVIIFWVD